MQALPDSSREADHRVEKAICVEIFKHALNRLAINPKGDTGHTQVQAAAYHILWFQKVLTGWIYWLGNASWGQMMENGKD